MQFEYNSDYPAATDPTARDPLECPVVSPIPCVRITTCVFHPTRNTMETVQNVLVRMAPRARRRQSRLLQQQQQDASMLGDSNVAVDSVASISSSSSSDLSDDESMEEATNEDDDLESETEECAYWTQRTIRDAIYGRVVFAVVLRKRKQPAVSLDGNTVEWEVTPQHCAVKEMSKQLIRRERDRLAEDPVKEVSAMQYLKEWHATYRRQQQQQPPSSNNVNGVQESFESMLQTNVMMPLDLLSDEQHLYSIMPYCNGGELFDLLNMNDRFSEPEARYWMQQILNGIESLQHAGICHRDMSLENLLVHESGALIIDMGMCLRLPIDETATSAANLSASFGNMNMNGATASANTTEAQSMAGSSNGCSVDSVHNQKRYMVTLQGTCGKMIYISPEIFSNRVDFDGFAIDMWAAGVILFLMLTGFPPWEQAAPTDLRFKYMTEGYLVQMLTEGKVGISSDSMDLLQRMLFLDPKDRLSLDQVRAHPWMVNGPCQPPRPPAPGGT